MRKSGEITDRYVAEFEAGLKEEQGLSECDGNVGGIKHW